MKMTVPDQVLKETTKCPHEFSCLDVEQDPGRDICDVWYADGNNVLFLKAKTSFVCPYRVQFGYHQVCTCPTHFKVHSSLEK